MAKSVQRKNYGFARVIFFKRFSILLDGAAVLFGFHFAMALYFGAARAAIIFQENLGFLVLLTGPIFLVFYLADLYPRYRYFDTLVRVIPLWKAMAYAMILQLILVHTLCPAIAPITVTAIFFEGWAITLCKLTVTVLARIFGPKDRALLIGYTPGDERYFDFLKLRPRLTVAIKIIGVIGHVKEHDNKALEQHGLPLLGDYSRLNGIISSEKISTLVISPGYDGHGELQKLLMIASQQGVRMIMLDELCAEVTQKIPYELVNKAELLAACLHQERYAWIKKKECWTSR